jgi:CDP-diacylglycerol--glycerol-3-phosphate 3-phosphatidyltransferase
MHKDILKLPNILTMIRIVMSAVLYLLFIRHFQVPGSLSPLFLFILYIVIALTDFVDGIIARKCNMVTELGKELDPMADKILVFLMLFAFYRIGILPLWIIIPVFARDLFVNYLRKQSRRRSLHFKTSNLAKAKTAVQMIFIGIVMAIPALMSMRIPEKLYYFLADFLTGRGIRISMIVIMLFTVYTGVDYYLKFRKEMKKM